jgi:hypothetical protein
MDDHDSIRNAVADLAALVDRREWGALERVFAPSVITDYTSLFGGDPGTSASADLVASWAEFLPRFSSTIHLVGTPSIRIDGDRATAFAPVVAWHFRGDALNQATVPWVVGGHYDIGLVRQGGEWRIDRLELDAVWQTGQDG